MAQLAYRQAIPNVKMLAQWRFAC